jgi:hypothetical protein
MLGIILALYMDMASINEIVNRVKELRVYGKQDQEIKAYILDLISLHSESDNTQVKLSICKVTDNYLKALEVNYFNRFN